MPNRDGLNDSPRRRGAPDAPQVGWGSFVVDAISIHQSLSSRQAGRLVGWEPETSPVKKKSSPRPSLLPLSLYLRAWSIQILCPFLTSLFLITPLPICGLHISCLLHILETLCHRTYIHTHIFVSPSLFTPSRRNGGSTLVSPFLTGSRVSIIYSVRQLRLLAASLQGLLFYYTTSTRGLPIIPRCLLLLPVHYHYQVCGIAARSISARWIFATEVSHFRTSRAHTNQERSPDHSFLKVLCFELPCLLFDSILVLIKPNCVSQPRTHHSIRAF
ncbi:hypothetical protein BO78DRAFT_34253 [Aspergillus sclerotiicarbonarius CBS 121057]|uniref:Uncharacterized protein n=1 Tax=Aspergillus sclerotiicarbonarius (strain CBS 121057 / IBT 28362) TaxID=1448318 RepID=A0A319DSW8_ASPSB|nr:hypothetical protein BO78DRAFT_34253 [Aspergillus sclerotiicarbonarius CBS 121057]